MVSPTDRCILNPPPTKEQTRQTHPSPGSSVMSTPRHLPLSDARRSLRLPCSTVVNAPCACAGLLVGSRARAYQSASQSVSQSLSVSSQLRQNTYTVDGREGSIRQQVTWRLQDPLSVL